MGSVSLPRLRVGIFADSALHAGISYRALVQRLVNLALEGRSPAEP